MFFLLDDMIRNSYNIGYESKYTNECLGGLLISNHLDVYAQGRVGRYSGLWHLIGFLVFSSIYQIACQPRFFGFLKYN